jgi:hypothetical protein
VQHLPAVGKRGDANNVATSVGDNGGSVTVGGEIPSLDICWIGLTLCRSEGYREVASV